MPLPATTLAHEGAAGGGGRASAPGGAVARDPRPRSTSALRRAAALLVGVMLAGTLAPVGALAAGPGAARQAAVAVAAPVSLAWPAAISPLARAAATPVGVSARDFRFALGRRSVPRGTVRFNLVNRGKAPHNLVVRARGGRELARTRIVTAGKRAAVSVRLAPGRYSLVCDVSNHEQLGMRASLRVARPRAGRATGQPARRPSAFR